MCLATVSFIALRRYETKCPTLGVWTRQRLSRRSLMFYTLYRNCRLWTHRGLSRLKSLPSILAGWLLGHTCGEPGRIHCVCVHTCNQAATVYLQKSPRTCMFDIIASEHSIEKVGDVMCLLQAHVGLDCCRRQNSRQENTLRISGCFQWGFSLRVMEKQTERVSSPTPTVSSLALVIKTRQWKH